MTTETLVRIFAGTFVLLSLGLGVPGSPIFASQNFLWFTAFVGANLLQSGFTGFCPLEMILRKLGVKSAAHTVCSPPRSST
jgi:hypothetical protein